MTDKELYHKLSPWLQDSVTRQELKLIKRQSPYLQQKLPLPGDKYYINHNGLIDKFPF